jgi:hypothetical protein
MSSRSVSICASSTASLKASSGVKPSGLCWQPGFYLRLEAYGFMGLSEIVFLDSGSVWLLCRFLSGNGTCKILEFLRRFLKPLIHTGRTD